MRFADIKNDFVFRRIFAKHPDLLRSLLNDLLAREGNDTIEHIDYLPSEQLPLVQGAKLSILDVRCRERSGNVFVVEMQLLHVPGFENRVVYNACKAYVGQLKAGQSHTTLANVIAISICDFMLWPDEKQDRAELPRVPMLSRWNMQEQGSRNAGLLQVQYVFLELPKLAETERPELGAPLWAWLFSHATELEGIPADLPEGPFRSTLELAKESTFTLDELDAYQRVMDEIQQARDYGEAQRLLGQAEGKAEGKAEGQAEGKAEGLAEGEAIGKILAYCEMFDVTVSDSRKALLADTKLAALITLLESLKHERRWPE